MKRLIPAALVTVLVLSACQTTSKHEAEAPPQSPVQFQPAYYQAKIHAEKGRYPELFSPDSYALWVGKQVAEAKWAQANEKGAAVDKKLQQDAVTVTEQFIVLECHLISTFGDMSVAYDVVGLRGVTAYLQMPDGKKVEPIQQLFQGALKQEQDGALKRFERTIILVFPKRDLWLQQPTIQKDAPGIKLMLDSNYGTFSFDWEGVPAGASAPTLTAQEAKEAIKVGFKDFYGNLRRLAHMFN